MLLINNRHSPIINKGLNNNDNEVIKKLKNNNPLEKTTDLLHLQLRLKFKDENKDNNASVK